VIVSFNPEFGKSIGMKVGAYEFLLSTMTVLAVSAGIQAVGVVLMAALLITPAATARIWTDKFGLMMFISSALAVFSALAGTWMSYQSPGMPTGPWIIMFLSVIAVLSVFLAPKRGIASRWLAARNNSRKIVRENVLKHIYQICEKSGDFKMMLKMDQIEGLHYMRVNKQMKILNALLKSNMLRRENQLWGLTDAGLTESMRIVRLHRLWEMYLNQKLHLKPDHVHEGAEAMEHLITPELEEMLKNDLGNPELDPHNSVIPYPHQP
jgi:manganese/zinc/iron transport system permease protein